MTGLISIHHLDMTATRFEQIWNGSRSFIFGQVSECYRAGDLVAVHEVINGSRTNRSLLLRTQYVLSEKERGCFGYCWDRMLRVTITEAGTVRKLVKVDV